MISAEQEGCVHALLAGHNVTVQAAAGAGKSTTFYHAAQAWLAAYPNDHIVQLCFNVVLRAEAEKKIAALNLQDRLHCFTVHALATHLYGTRVSDSLSLYLSADLPARLPHNLTFGLCLLDEAQDLNEDHIQVINRLQTLMPTPMRYMVVGDLRQEIYAHARTLNCSVMEQPSAFLLDNQTPWLQCQLQTSYRLTPTISTFLNAVMRHPTQAPILPGNTSNKSIRPMYVIGNRDSDDVANLVLELLKTYAPGDVMILAPSVGTPRHKCQRLAKRLMEQTQVPIYSTHKQRAEVSADMIQHKLFLSTFHQSKGYERKCVVVLGVDAEEWVLNSSPVGPDGKPLVHNALHVALTRAREQLVLFQHHGCEMYPTLQQQPLHEWVDVYMLKTPMPRALKPLSKHVGLIEDNWLISFQPRGTLEAVVKFLSLPTPTRVLEAPHQHIVAPPSWVVMGPNLAEDVGDYWLEAILSWAEYRYTGKPTLLEHNLKRVSVPDRFRAHVHTRHPLAEHWMVRSMVHNTLVQHNYPHELHQMTHLEWFGLREAAYIAQSVQNVLAVLPTKQGFWHECSQRLLLATTTLRARARFVVWDAAGQATPWQFLLGDVYSEANLLQALIQLYVFQCQQVVLYCIPSATMYTVISPGDDEVQDLLTRMLLGKA